MRHKWLPHPRLFFLAISFATVFYLVIYFSRPYFFEDVKTFQQLIVYKQQSLQEQEIETKKSETIINTTTHRSVVTHCHPLSEALSNLKISSTGIPNLLHMIYADSRPPKQYVDLMKKCLQINHPDMHFVLWTNEDAQVFLKDHEAARKLSIFDVLKFELERSDVLRYLVLHHFGGMYMDMDEECVRPLWPLLNSAHSCLLDMEDPAQSQLWHNRSFIAMNSAMACRPKHPFFDLLLTTLPTYVARQGNVIDRTGPIFLTDVYLRYQATRPTAENNVTILPSSAFSPLRDPSPNVLEDFRKRCEDQQRLAESPIIRLGCAAFAQDNYGLGNVTEKIRNAYLIHQFMHLGNVGGRKNVRTYKELCRQEETIGTEKMSLYRYSLH